MASGGVACMRYILFTLNVVFVIFGCLLIYTGFSTFVSLNKYDLVFHDKPDGAAISLLVIGFIIFLISFLGCCGSILRNGFMLKTFSFIILLLLIIELVSVAFVFTFKKTIHQTMQSGFEEAIIKYNESDKDSAISIMVDDVQSHFKCCGANGPSDWKNNTNYPGSILPKSCCSKDMNFINSTAQCTNFSRHLFLDGCVNIITNELQNSVGSLYTVSIIIIVIQIFVIIFACMVPARQREYSYI